MANCCQKVRGKKANQRANNNKTKNKNKTTNNQTNKQKQQQNRRMEVEGYKANNYSNVIINIDLRETHTHRGRGLKHVLVSWTN